ncbi:uncharacterized protein LOC105851031 [Hydra vulgaris]|uniref:Uncharacterized protein LOC105851031 n=1 Tax=Hydra vulgaris TaxID=6087 RepID=A0ABM4CDM1_HYDVU
MVHCCVPGCKNTHHHKNRGSKDEWGCQSSDSRSFSLHDLPNEDRMDIRELWIMAINRTSLPKDVAVCSDHFTEDCFDEKWEEYKRKYGPTKVKRKLKVDAIPTIFPGRIFVNEKVQLIKNNWKNKVLQKRMEMEKMRLDREFKDRFKYTQTDCECKCKCKLKKKNFSQQVNFQFKFMEDVGVQFPIDVHDSVNKDHSYTHGKGKVLSKDSGKVTASTTSVSESTPLQTVSTNYIKNLIATKLTDINDCVINAMNENSVNSLYENSVNALNENSVNSLYENSVNALNEGSGNALNENSVGSLYENSSDALNENSVNVLNEISGAASDSSITSRKHKMTIDLDSDISIKKINLCNGLMIDSTED